MITWVNGELNATVIWLGDPGFTWGLGIFETLAVVDGRPRLVERHIARLTAAAQRLGLPVPHPDDVRNGVDEVCEQVETPLQRMRITWTDGGTLAISCLPAEAFAGPLRVVTAPWVRNERSPLAGVKSTAYAENVLALRWAREHDADEALLADTQGRLSEGTFTNVFVLTDDGWHTPALETGCLPGVMRAVVLEAMSAAGHSVSESLLAIGDLASARQMLLTNSLRGVVSVSHVNGRELVTDPSVAKLVARYARELDG